MNASWRSGTFAFLILTKLLSSESSGNCVLVEAQIPSYVSLTMLFNKLLVLLSGLTTQTCEWLIHYTSLITGKGTFFLQRNALIFKFNLIVNPKLGLLELQHSLKILSFDLLKICCNVKQFSILMVRLLKTRTSRYHFKRDLKPAMRRFADF